MENIITNVQYEPTLKLNPNKIIEPSIVWFTGMSGVGKSTISAILKSELNRKNCRSSVLDGDMLRQGLNKNLGFSTADRSESVRRAGEVARLLVDTGTIVIGALISPFEDDRQKIKKLLEDYRFIEIYLYAPMEILINRDPKGLYRKARAGLINNFTGISSDYEAPSSPDLAFDTSVTTAEMIAGEILSHLEYIPKRREIL
ncbi:adenylyl-sulfate kinase [Pseudomonas sp. RL_5y_Pfl2_73]|uniref:adenylyl-sulfate kinase n=1 Tax=Pseudomonas sp. RL_5y_Pfl2_73 TaxID=3088713 RepID=UPI0030D9B48D